MPSKATTSTRPQVAKANDKRDAERKRLLEQAQRENKTLREKVATGLAGLHRIAER